METKQKSTMMLAILALLLGLVGSATAGWVTSGNNMYADVPGNVGIGTGMPEEMFHVMDGEDWASMLLGRSEGGGFVGFNAFFNDGNWKRVNATYDGAFIRSNVSTDDPSTQLQIGFVDHTDDSTSQVMVVRKDGNVGIGTGMPEEMFHVMDGEDWASMLLGRSEGGGFVGFNAFFKDGNWKRVNVPNNGAFIRSNVSTDDSSTQLQIGFVDHTDDSNSQVMVICKDGYVGIGTESPAEKLTVRGNLLVEGGTIESTSVHGTEEVAGVHGLSDKGYGVHGYSNTGFGVWGYSPDGNGVRGSSPRGYAGAFMGKVRIQTMPKILLGQTVKWESDALGGNGTIGVEVSSARFKENIEPLTDDFHKILKTEPKSFTPKGSSLKGIGFIAEDFDELGLSHLLIYEDGKPLSIRYELISVYLAEVLKEQVETTRRLEAEIELLKLQLDALDQ